MRHARLHGAGGRSRQRFGKSVQTLHGASARKFDVMPAISAPRRIGDALAKAQQIPYHREASRRLAIAQVRQRTAAETAAAHRHTEVSISAEEVNPRLTLYQLAIGGLNGYVGFAMVIVLLPISSAVAAAN